MAEYIDRTKLEPDTEWSEYEDGFMSYSQSQINSLPKVDVIERSEYDELHKKYLKAIHNHTECLKELHEYRSKIDKAIEEINKLYDDFANCFCEYEQGKNKAIDEVLEILKRI